LRDGRKGGQKVENAVEEVEMVDGDAIVARIGKIVSCRIP
jgi:hypothetical protein